MRITATSGSPSLTLVHPKVVERSDDSPGGGLGGRAALRLCAIGLVETDARFGGGRRRLHELADGVEDHLELCVVLLLKRFELAFQVGVGDGQCPHADEGAHDLDVDLDGARAPEDAGEHGYALLREGVGGGPPETSPT